MNLYQYVMVAHERVANLRLVLQARVQSGTSYSAAQTLPGLIELICRLPEEKRPKLVRGDCAFGNERVMRELEDIGPSWLFKLKQSSNVKKLCAQQWQHAAWCDAGQGWEAREGFPLGRTRTPWLCSPCQKTKN